MGLLQVSRAQGYHDMDDEKPSTGATGPKERVYLGKREVQLLYRVYRPIAITFLRDYKYSLFSYLPH